MLTKIVVFGAIAAAGTSVTASHGTDWTGLATFISALGSLIGTAIAAYVALRKRDTTEEMLMKMLQDHQRESEDDDPPKRRRRKRL